VSSHNCAVWSWLLQLALGWGDKQVCSLAQVSALAQEQEVAECQCERGRTCHRRMGWPCQAGPTGRAWLWYPLAEARQARFWLAPVSWATGAQN